jgi:hypothetical protein
MQTIKLFTTGLVLALALFASSLAHSGVPVRKSIAVLVLPTAEADKEVALQVRKIAVDTLENYRNLITRRFLSERDQKKQEELQDRISRARQKVSTGLRSKVFDTGRDELNQAYLETKGLLGELEPKLVADLYLGMAMAEATMISKKLAQDYMTTYANLKSDSGRQSVAYNKKFTAVWDAVEARRNETRKYKVIIKAEPPDALIGLDGRTWGKSPLEVELTPGNHLIQVEAEGFHRQGWLKDPELHGLTWTIKLKPFAARTRYLRIVERLRLYYSPLPEQPTGKNRKKRRKKSSEQELQRPADDQVESLLASLQKLLNVDYLLFVIVRSEGSTINLDGSFISAFGIRSLKTSAKRDATIIESVRETLLAITNVESQKEELARKQEVQARSRLDNWASNLHQNVTYAELRLVQRGELWSQAGKARKAQVFSVTAKELRELLDDVRQARLVVSKQPEEARKQLDAVSKKWRIAEGKFNSVMAWDIDRVIQGGQVKAAGELATYTHNQLKTLKEVVDQKLPAVDKKLQKDILKLMKNMNRWREAADKKMAKNPLDDEARKLLYRILIKQAHLRRELSVLQ